MADFEIGGKRANRYGPGNMGRSTILPDVDITIPMPVRAPRSAGSMEDEGPGAKYGRGYLGKSLLRPDYIVTIPMPAGPALLSMSRGFGPRNAEAETEPRRPDSLAASGGQRGTPIGWEGRGVLTGDAS